VDRQVVPATFRSRGNQAFQRLPALPVGLKHELKH